jgi:hypothetical protein
MLEALKNAKLKTMTTVRERGRISVDSKSGYQSAMLMDTAKGHSIAQLVESLPDEPVARREAMKNLKAAMRRAAEGLSELHGKFGSRGPDGKPVMMTEEMKLSDANYLLDKNFRNGSDVGKVRYALGERDFERVKAALEGPVLKAFLDAKVPASAYHGDANAGNFLV